MNQRNNNFEHLFQALGVNPRREVISLVGGGGKTTAMLRLAKELSHTGKRVIFTTTTHTSPSGFPLIRYSSVLSEKIIKDIEKTMWTDPAFVAKRIVRGEKIKGITTQQVDTLNREVSFDYMIIEADGARRKPLKAPHRYEPQVPKCTTLFIPVIGYDSVGKRLNQEEIHRPQLVARIIKKPLNSIITHEDIIKLLQSPLGLMKGRPPATRTSVIINKVTPVRSRVAEELSLQILKQVPGIKSVVCGEVKRHHQLLLFT